MRSTLRKIQSRSTLWSTLILALSVTALPAAAVNGNLKQQILPIDCVYQIVNDGTGTIIYLTPQECGQVVPDPDPDNEPTPTPTPTPTTPIVPTEGNVVTVVDSGSRVFQVPFVSVPNAGPGGVVAGTQFLPYVPLATIQPSSTSEVREKEFTNTVAVATPIIAMIAIALILVVLLFLV